MTLLFVPFLSMLSVATNQPDFRLDLVDSALKIDSQNVVPHHLNLDPYEE